jgi:hypothetical protein
MPDNHKAQQGSGFKDRLLFAWFRWQALQGKQMQQAELGESVGKILKRKPVTPSSVSRWFTEAEPDLQVICAIARSLGVDPGWLAFGPDSQAPAPNDPAMPTPMPHPTRGRAG